MDAFEHIRGEIVALVERRVRDGALPAGLDTARIAVEPPREAAHGDLATNAAMVLAKPAARPPREIAVLLARELRALKPVTDAAVAGPGFINLRLEPEFWRERLAEVLRLGTDYGNSALGRGEPVNVEYVSANPTGRLHVGHARGAVFGDVLSALLEKAGFRVTREYYVNDAGRQVEILTESFLKRQRQARGETVPASEFDGLYPGEEVADAARAALASGRAPSSPDEARAFAVDYMMQGIREDLAALGVHHDVFTSERALVASGAVDAALQRLDRANRIYIGRLDPPKGKLPDDWEERDQTLFRARDFGDDADRPLKKSDGSWTYFATDIAYHLDKFRRGFRTMVDVWGADHGGYIKRVSAAVAAVTGGDAALDVKICQLVNLRDRGEPVKMSKRAGTVVSLRDVLDRVGKDVLRFIMMTRKNDAALDFDFAKVQEQTKDNPVFYVQYAHARCRSVFRQAREALPNADFEILGNQNNILKLLTNYGELDIIKTLAQWPRVVASAASAHEPHRIAFFLYDLAATFHGHWNRGKEEASLRFIVEGNEPLSLARLALVRGVQLVIASGLHVMGVEPVEEMR